VRNTIPITPNLNANKIAMGNYYYKIVHYQYMNNPIINTSVTQNLTPSTMTDAIGNLFAPTLQVSPIQTMALPMTMSSLELSAITGKRHPHLMRDITKMLNALGEVNASKFGSIYLDAYKREKPCYKLPRREVDILLTGYSVPLRALIIDRWHQKEAQINTALISAYADQITMLTLQVEKNAEKVALYDGMADTTQLFGVAQVAKTLGTGGRRLFAYMRDHKILSSKRYRFNEPYQHHQEAGRFQVKWGSYKNKATGNIELKPTTYFTGKGVIWIGEFITNHGFNGL
jgi:anti-repressor protein